MDNPVDKTEQTTDMDKKILLTAAAALTLGGLASCSQSASQKNDVASTGVTAVDGFEVEQNIMSDSRYYRAVSDTDTFYLTMTTTMQYPEKLGGTEVKVLQDSVLTALYGTGADVMTPKEAIETFLADVVPYGLGTTTAVDTIPDSSDGTRCLYVARMGEISEVNKLYLTYSILSTQYMGGAHPMTYTASFTYSIDKGCVLTYDNMFTQGSEAALTKAVRETIADQFEITPDKLTDAGFFSNDIQPSRLVSVQDGAIVFHYNPYEIAPYAMGPINVAIPAYQLRDSLTPLAKSILPNVSE